jgi:Xaa-Pro aminopeptidase
VPGGIRPAIPTAILAVFASLLSGEAGLRADPLEVPREEFRSRRIALVSSLRADLPEGGTGVAIFRSAPAAPFATFRQDSDLYYLTGTEIPGSTLVLLFDRPAGAKGRKPAGKASGGRFAEFFYLPERDYREERWTGPRPGAGGLRPETLEPDEERNKAMQVTGFDRPPDPDYPPRNYPKGPVERASDLSAHLRIFLRGADVLFFAADPGSPGEALSPALAYLRDLRDRFPTIRVADPSGALARLRMIKSPAEIALLRKAIAITCEAHRDAWSRIRSGMTEYQIQAVIEHRFLHEGARRPGFPSIVGSGPNSCVLHYDASARTVETGDLVVIDVGAEFRRYSADVTRTVPVGGRFTEEQLKIYRIVLEAQRRAIAAIRPGVPFTEIHKVARKAIEEAGYLAYFLHGTSHFLGLDVHDAGDTGAELRAGMVLTVEPGIYLAEKSIGVRIEDDVLVTERGAEILSDCLPRDPAAVEMQMAGGLGAGGR